MQQTHFYEIWLSLFASVCSPSIFLATIPCRPCWIMYVHHSFKIWVLFSHFIFETRSGPLIFCISGTTYSLSDCSKILKNKLTGKFACKHPYLWVFNRFGVMQHLAFFAMIFGIWAKKGTESLNYNYEWEPDFMFLQGWNAGFQILILKWPPKLLLTSAKTKKWQKQTCCVYSCVRFQVMNSNSSVPSQILSNLSIIALLR